MNTINQRWKDYCNQISETARRFVDSETSPNDHITDALNRFVSADPPTTESELEIRIGQGDQLISQWQAGRMADAQSGNRGSMPVLSEGRAAQSEMASQNIRRDSK